MATRTCTSIAVVGAGVQGCCVALELADRGVDVDLFDRRPAAMEGASRHCEGKVHLGYVYAGDETLRTARLMAQGAATFLPGLRRWIDGAADTLAVSEPFHYAVHRESLHGPDDLERRYTRIRALIDEHVPAGTHPEGDLPVSDVRRLGDDEVGATFGPDVVAAFRTQEISIHPDELADALAAAVDACPRVTLRAGTRVLAADRDESRLQVAEDDDPPAWTPAYDHVVNCAWEGRLALDATTGIVPAEPWSFRMKYFLRVKLPPGAPAMPNTTVVLGPFGDVVHLGRGDHYISWYPVGRQGWSTAVEPPDWPTEPGEDVRRALLEGMGDGMDGVLPGMAGLVREHADRASVRGGVIYALGSTDVEDPGSVLHERRRVGPFSYGAYHTVDTGKRTMAPLFALELADRIAPRG